MVEGFDLGTIAAGAASAGCWSPRRALAPATLLGVAAGKCASPPCSCSFDKGWAPMSFTTEKAEAEFYGDRGMTYQITGQVSVDKNRGVVADYQATAYKSWNCDKREKLSGVSFGGAAKPPDTRSPGSSP
ncbi:hypothetical protein AB0J80_27875 [Actinoplanes sp. NPDC049548]|uniref:hypothetical protein n=1 Tax=Actinoplanes sp. NPDC049548 TaxID=3155152 RepID=UPI003446B053